MLPQVLALGCLVTARTLSHVRPFGFICLGDVATSSGIGSKHTLLLHNPTEKPVNPAIVPWTAFCASCIQYRVSVALAGTDRIMYDGSMYLINDNVKC